MFNECFDELPEIKHKEVDLNPSNLRAQMEEVNEWIYPSINNGVYRCGFATKQEPYDKAYEEVFQALDKLEEILSKKRFLTGNTLTLSDIRLWTTLLRFDAVYHKHFKCNKKKLIEYPNIQNYTREIYQMEGVKCTVNFEHIKKHYYMSHTSINPHQIVPVGPILSFDVAHNRNTLSTN